MNALDNHMTTNESLIVSCTCDYCKELRMHHERSNEFKRLVKELAGGTVFSVFFTKRTTGEKREMICRLNANGKVKGDAGLGPAYNALEKGLLTVWDMHKAGWRSIPIESIEWIKIRGVVYQSNMVQIQL